MYPQPPLTENVGLAVGAISYNVGVGSRPA